MADTKRAKIAQKINYSWRLIATAIAFTIFGLGGVLVPLLALPILALLPGGHEKRQRRARYLVHLAALLFIHFMRLLGILRWRFAGLGKLEREGQLVLANHPTLLDVVFLIALMPNANCIVKGKLVKNPTMRGVVSLSGYIVNDVGESLLDDASASLQQGSSLIVFPEGTRTPPNGQVELQRGAARIALYARVAPTLVVIRCEPPTLSKQHKWYHIPDRRFVIAIDVQHDLRLDSYLELNPAQGARYLTRDLQNYYTGELESHGTRST